MNVNPMYELVARHQHEPDMPRADEFRMLQEARQRSGAKGFLAKFFDRLTKHNKAVVERVPETKPRAAV